MTPRSLIGCLRSSPGLLAAVLALLCSSPLLAQTQSQTQTKSQIQPQWRNPERREAMQRQQAEAMSRLSASQRQQYFAARRELEQRGARQRLEQLSQAERCLVPARDLTAVERCQRTQQQQAMQQRRQQMADLAQLRRRFGLPGWGKEPGPSAQ
jgi:hypothetical protein